MTRLPSQILSQKNQTSTIMTSYFISKQVLSSEISELIESDSDNFLSFLDTRKGLFAVLLIICPQNQFLKEL